MQRLLFHTYLAFCLITVVGGFLTAPLITWLFFGDWRFWRHWRSGAGLLPHGYRMLGHMVTGRNGGFLLDVPFTAPPSSSANLDLVRLSPTWDFGTSCGPCHRCCSMLGCPVLDYETGLCQGYDSFFWRYFNCGRFPSSHREIEFYLCNKWALKSPSRNTSGPATPNPMDKTTRLSTTIAGKGDAP
ncbi:MAG: hypothetical protein IIC64_18595 [SAR324 cluster bacterium]|nr:hypothetical protein [SAR324 cluster bacterium]